MDWIKVKTRHIICDFDCIDPKIGWAWIQVMGITATLERIPAEEQLRQKVGEETYEELLKLLKRNGTSLPEVLRKVMEDVEKYSIKKERHRLYMKSSRDSSRDNSRDTHVERKIREEKKDIVGQNREIIHEVVMELNSVLKTSFRAETKSTERLILARVREGRTLDDFRTVIHKKAKRWKNDPKMSIYLRPSTLFGSKFDEYLNEKPAEEVKNEPKRAYVN